MMKKIISLIISIVIVISGVFACGLNAAASGSSSIAFSKKTVDVGDSVTVTVNVSSNEAMYAVQFAVQYDPEVLKFKSGDSCSGGAGVLTVVDALDGVKKRALKYTFEAVKAGSCYISTADTVYVNKDYQEVSVSNQGASMTVKDVSLSSNAKLNSLKLSEGKLSPAFSSSKTSYKVSVGKSVTECKVYATADDEDAKVKVEGGSNLKVGNNTCKITVTAANGNQKVYTVVITREKEDDTSSEDNSSEEDTSSDEESSDETSSEEPKETLETEIEGKKYTVATDLKGEKLPEGFEKSVALYNELEVAVAKDAAGNYVIYYLVDSETKEKTPYTLDEETKTFEKLKYIEQNGRIYIFAEIPEGFELPSGYYLTGKLISDFNINCYASENPELSDFYYMYCFNGSDYSFYRYDNDENVIQRYPELTLVTSTNNDVQVEKDNIKDRFLSLTNNAKIVVLGTLALVLFLLIFVILLVFRILIKRGRAEYISNMGYEDFDSIEYNNSFSIANEDFLLEEEETNVETTEEEDVPEYLLDDDE